MENKPNTNTNNLHQNKRTINIINQHYFQEVESIIICNICNGIVYNPLKCSSCDTFFCSECIQNRIQQNKVCPHCNEELNTKSLSKNEGILINKVLVQCELGCQVGLLDFPSHLEKCQLQKEVECWNCKSLVKQNKILLKEQEYYNLLDKIKILEDENKNLKKALSSNNENSDSDSMLFENERLPGVPAEPENLLNNEIDPLFPLFGLTIGKSSKKDLLSLYPKSKQPDSNYNYYEINKVNFWFNNSTDIFNSMYFARGIYKLPEEWVVKGFTYNNSFNQCLSKMKELFPNSSIEIIKKPTQEYQDFKKSTCFSATIRITLSTYYIDLGFDYEVGNSDTKNTLYNISIKTN